MGSLRGRTAAGDAFAYRDMARSLGGGRLRLWRVTLGEDPWEPADAPGRWSASSGVMIYASTVAALAVLEARAHLNAGQGRRTHRLTWIEVPVRPGEVACLRGERLPEDWRRRKRVTRALGEAFLTQARSAALLVPSALAAGELNVLVNPAHPRWQAWRRKAEDRPFRFDARLVRAPGDEAG